MALPLIENYDDAKLDELRIAVANEIERRANLATIPATILQLASTYVAGGGNPADLSVTVE